LVTALPIVLHLLDKPASFVWTSLVLAVFAYIRHYDNIRNLLSGKERKLGEKAQRKLD
jgi:glycerol-3-phosphate acyltransferase PlsY